MFPIGRIQSLASPAKRKPFPGRFPLEPLFCFPLTRSSTDHIWSVSTPAGELISKPQHKEACKLDGDTRLSTDDLNWPYLGSDASTVEHLGNQLVFVFSCHKKRRGKGSGGRWGIIIGNWKPRNYLLPGTAPTQSINVIPVFCFPIYKAWIPWAPKSVWPTVHRAQIPEGPQIQTAQKLQGPKSIGPEIRRAKNPEGPISIRLKCHGPQNQSGPNSRGSTGLCATWTFT